MRGPDCCLLLWECPTWTSNAQKVCSRYGIDGACQLWNTDACLGITPHQVESWHRHPHFEGYHQPATGEIDPYHSMQEISHDFRI